jgi:PPOX class probable FMN-dependent enzyme
MPDVSPKGDGPGFVAVADDRTLLIPDRKGNRLIFGLQNILVNPRISVIFLLPGTGETLRVTGVAEITADPEVLEALTDERGKPALLAIRLRVEKAFFHCAKALIRSRLWQPDAWQELYRVSFGRIMAKKLGGADELEKTIDEAVAESYRTQL